MDEMENVFDLYFDKGNKEPIKKEFISTQEAVTNDSNSIVNKRRRENDLTDSNDNLEVMIEQTTYLSKEKKTTFKTLARHYLEDMFGNLFLSQFQLVDKYPETNIDVWAEFLNDRIISNYIEKHKRTVLKSSAEIGLNDPFGKNKRENINLLKDIEEKDRKERQNNIIILRIPNKYEARGKVIKDDN